ncbi:uncharacterized protein FIBRA_08410 [Fibroporia radiculosa]|uniref:Ubiquitin 3 binding protein But2 C-terminal domain-containing protein n=1 Tax=Fibroporia radiculosa TaxID=599839 RepID=J4H559_9APHY|nr:uncharacterized protein FIBRA_08410 [Fibroporia radiculosa]CCM06169.1 predicted protein [Fibroporia radiculosa]
MFASRFRSEYRRVLASPTGEDDHAYDAGSDDEKKPAGTMHLGRFATLSLVVCIVCTVANVLIACKPMGAGMSMMTMRPPAPLTRQDMHRLRRPSQFIGLADIHRPVPPVPRQFDNWPMLVAQVDSADSDKVFRSHRAHMTHSGTVVPEDRHIQTTSTVTSIVQFRAIDFGMETCELRVVIDPASSFTATLRPFMLSLYRLNASIPLNAATLSYKTRPPRLTEIDTVEVRAGAALDWHRNFACATEEVITIELACEVPIGEKDCDLEWWQNKDLPASAIYITQHSTV